MSARAAPRYLAIVAELRGQIASGTLRAGRPVPSTREITRRWGVAMATATRVLATLRDEGLVRAVAGVGTVVAGRGPREAGAARRAGGDGDARAAMQARLARAGVSVADAEGLEAVTLRRIAAELEMPTMSLYRHVASKDALVVLMLDAAFADDPPPRVRPLGWRAQLEVGARLQWAVYRKHPWLAQALSLSFTRPTPAPLAMAHTEWALAALAGLGLEPAGMFYAAVTLVGYVHGTALKLLSETDARHETGMTDDEWMAAREPELAAVIAAGPFPILAQLTRGAEVTMDLDGLFEFGLARLLDGYAAHFAARARPRGRGAHRPRA